MNQNYPPLITSEIAIELLNGARKVSLDLGLTKTEIKIERDTIFLNDKPLVSLNKLNKVLEKKDTIFFLKDDEIFMAAISDVHYYKLVNTSDAPTIEIDGIRMHRTKGTTPTKDAILKLKFLGVDKGKILDTCTGLGYTAIESLKNKSELVITIEKDFNVIRIAQLNPWSRNLFDQKIHNILGDSYQIVNFLPKNFFDYIIHDPPRLSFAGNLYSEVFYEKMYSILNFGGKLLHYTGEPGSKYRRIDLQKGVQNRLKSVGFKKINYYPEIMSIICEK